MEDWTALGPRSPRYADFRVGNQEAQPQTLLDAVAGHGEEGFEGMDKIHIGRGIETQSESCLLGRGPLIQLVEQQRSFQNVKGSEIASLQRQQKKKGKVTQKVLRADVQRKTSLACESLHLASSSTDQQCLTGQKSWQMLSLHNHCWLRKKPDLSKVSVDCYG